MSSKLRFGLLLVLIALSGSVRLTLPQLSVDQILDQVNEDRVAAGLPELKLDTTLNSAAMAKAQDMLKHRYFDHVSPAGTKPWHFFKSLGYNYVYAGENLALNYSDAKDLEESWMSSPKHRDNILSPYYSDLGLAVVREQQTTIIVQFFGGKDSKLSLEK